ncbi:peptidoglycan D,D-transpeptidase FtsI family protein [Anaerobacillus alkaliphilus]|nr:penicillin-binding protein 2 [Anaerobacillus alkaliphilus]
MTVRKRMIWVLGIFLLAMFVFIIRLAYVQLIATHHITKYDIDLVQESIKQRTKKFVLHSGRGYFTDRNGQSLHMDYFPSLILFPYLKEEGWSLSKVAQILNIDTEKLITSIEHANEPFIFKDNGVRRRLSITEMNKINELKIPGVYAHFVQERTENIAPHLVGVVGENVEEVKKRYKAQVENGTLSVHTEIGVSGMERSLDPFLISQGSSELNYFVDNLGRPLFGYDVRYHAPADPYHPTEVVTTLDKDIQNYVTDALKETGLTYGGAVLLDVKTNDLISLVSLPTFNIHFPFDEGAKNHIVSSYTPGSIFKIVVAAAAIDQNITNKFDLFDCNRNLYGDQEEPRMLGSLTFQESFAQSCNYTFAKLASEMLKTDNQVLQRYAEKLGLVDKVGWNGDIYRLENIAHFPEEEEGTIIVSEEDIGNPYAIAQTAIGQKNVRVTPLAVANMLATIARGGEKRQVRSATKIKYENGTTVVEFPTQQLGDGNQISTYTAMRLQELLRSVVKQKKGTANSKLSNSPYLVAGKTGTAEKGKNKEKLSHWFAGYFPADKPKYVLVIVDLDHHSGNYKTLKAYQKIVKYLYEFDQN